jgi:sulfur-oxidizing protein SoxX
MTRLSLILFGLGIPALAAASAPLVDYVVENASSIPDPLVAWDGPSAMGAAVFVESGCVDCHRAPGFEGGPNIGPDLADAGARLTPGEIRLMIVEPAISTPETEMPAYYSVGIAGAVDDDLVGRTRLSAEEVEQLVAWLSSLKAE